MCVVYALGPVWVLWYIDTKYENNVLMDYVIVSFHKSWPILWTKAVIKIQLLSAAL